MNILKKSSAVKSFGFHLLVCSLICAAIYLPVVLSSFEKHDDYIIDSCDPATFCGDNPDFSYYVRIGRILAAEITFCFLQPLYCEFQHVNFFIILRILSLGFIAFAAGAFSFWIARVCRLDKWIAVMIATLLFTLPGYQFLIGQALAVNNSCAFVFVMLALLVLRDNKISGEWREIFESKKRIAFSILLLIIPLFIYNPHTLWFLIPSSVLLLLTPSSDMKRKRIIILRHFLTLGLAIMLFFVIQKVIIEPIYLKLHPEVNFNVSKRVLVESNLSKIISNMTRSFHKGKAFNLWFVQDSYTPGWVFYYFVLATFVVFLIKDGVTAWKQREFSAKLRLFGQYLLGVFFIYVGVNSIQIFFEPTMGFFRILLHYSAFMVILLLWGLRFWLSIISRKNSQKVFIAILLLLAVSASGMAQYNTMHDFAYLSMSEIDFLEAELHPLLEKRVSTVYIIRPRGNPRVSGDEHGIPTTRYANTYGLQGMLRRIYRRNRKDFSNIEITNMPMQDDWVGYVVKVTDKELEQQGNKNEFVIHMDKFLKIRVLGYRE